jgi:protoporphyrinogen oxidase
MVYANTFPAAYTRKYWTLEPEQLDPAFIGMRLGFPTVEDVTQGYHGPIERNAHYISTSRYPRRGGYISYARKLARGARTRLGHTVERIDFSRRWIGFADGTEHTYRDIVSTLPLPVLVGASTDAPEDVKRAASKLVCTQGYTIEVLADHPLRRPEHWIYVYDLDKYTTRVSFMNRWAPENAPPDTSAVQVEFYGSPMRPLPADRTAVAKKVITELIEMGIVDDEQAVIGWDVHHIPWANVIFDHNRAQCLELVNDYLDTVGVLRAGRFGHWKYMWTDGAVLTGRAAAESLR